MISRENGEGEFQTPGDAKALGAPLHTPPAQQAGGARPGKPGETKPGEAWRRQEGLEAPGEKAGKDQRAWRRQEGLEAPGGPGGARRAWRRQEGLKSRAKPPNTTSVSCTSYQALPHSVSLPSCSRNTLKRKASLAASHYAACPAPRIKSQPQSVFPQSFSRKGHDYKAAVAAFELPSVSCSAHQAST